MQNTLNIKQLTTLSKNLDSFGLVLCDVESVKKLPASVWLGTPSKDSGSLLLIGHGGRSFWEAYQQNIPQVSDPIDHFSASTSEQLLEQHLPAIKRQQLFPENNCPINLMALGRALGWHISSPLGMGISPDYGMWSAYRALWWLDTEIISTPRTFPEDICAYCETQECINTCPAGALTINNMPDLEKCADFRLKVESPCASTCLARMACPVAEQHRYTPEQMAYHYDLSRSQIRAFANKQSI